MSIDTDSKTPSLDNLCAQTEQFFHLHWNHQELGTPPFWSETYVFEGGNLPNHNRQGVYAFVDDQTVTYIGVGASTGRGKSAGHGLGKRFQSYSRVVDGRHTAMEPRLVSAGSIITLGFDNETAYLAASLEIYLISRLDTEHNTNRPGRLIAD